MGTLCERKNAQVRELRDTYHGVLMILRHFMSKDSYTEHHSHRVSVYAATLAGDDGARRRSDRGRQGGGHAARHRQARHQPRAALQGREADQRRNTKRSSSTSARASSCSSRSAARCGGSFRSSSRITTSSTASGYHPTEGEAIPIEARIISVADVYDSLTSDRPYRKAMSPFEARDIIVKGSETEFDPKVVAAFQKAFRLGRLEDLVHPDLCGVSSPLTGD